MENVNIYRIRLKILVPYFLYSLKTTLFEVTGGNIYPLGNNNIIKLLDTLKIQ